MASGIKKERCAILIAAVSDKTWKQTPKQLIAALLRITDTSLPTGPDLRYSLQKLGQLVSALKKYLVTKMETVHRKKLKKQPGQKPCQKALTIITWSEAASCNFLLAFSFSGGCMRQQRQLLSHRCTDMFQLSMLVLMLGKTSASMKLQWLFPQKPWPSSSRANPAAQTAASDRFQTEQYLYLMESTESSMQSTTYQKGSVKMSSRSKQPIGKNQVWKTRQTARKAANLASRMPTCLSESAKGMLANCTLAQMQFQNSVQVKTGPRMLQGRKSMQAKYMGRLGSRAVWGESASWSWYQKEKQEYLPTLIMRIEVMSIFQPPQSVYMRQKWASERASMEKAKIGLPALARSALVSAYITTERARVSQRQFPKMWRRMAQESRVEQTSFRPGDKNCSSSERGTQSRQHSTRRTWSSGRPSPALSPSSHCTRDRQSDCAIRYGAGLQSVMFNIYFQKKEKSPLFRRNQRAPSIRISNIVHIHTKPRIDLSYRVASRSKSPLLQLNPHPSKGQVRYCSTRRPHQRVPAPHPEPARRPALKASTRQKLTLQIMESTNRRKVVRMPLRRQQLREQHATIAPAEVQASPKQERPAKSKDQFEELKLMINEVDRLEEYRLVEHLGQGGYAEVYKGVSRMQNKVYAVKIYDKLKLPKLSKLESIRREGKILKELAQLRPVGINLIKDYFEFKSLIYLVLEYCSGGSLFERIKQPESLLKGPVRQLAQALHFLEQRHIVHRDIKAENALFNAAGKLKLIDFGFSLKLERGELVSTYCGTPTYMAPEIVRRVPHDPYLSDRWSLGVLVYLLIEGDYPFKGESEEELFGEICGKDRIEFDKASPQARALVLRLLAKEPRARLSYQEVLKSSWLN